MYHIQGATVYHVHGAGGAPRQAQVYNKHSDYSHSRFCPAARSSLSLAPAAPPRQAQVLFAGSGGSFGRNVFSAGRNVFLAGVYTYI